MPAVNNADLRGVSCPTIVICYAVGNKTVLKYSGTTWFVENAGMGEGLNAISCVSEIFCLAVGSRDTILAKSSNIVTSLADNNVPGTLRYALSNATQGQTIKINIPNGTTITPGSQLPPLPLNVKIIGSCTTNGPAITINGNGLSANGLTLNGKNSINGLKITGFGGKLINFIGLGNKLSCVSVVR